MRVSASTVMKYRLSCIRLKTEGGSAQNGDLSQGSMKKKQIRTWARLFVTPTGSLFSGAGRSRGGG